MMSSDDTAQPPLTPLTPLTRHPHWQPAAHGSTTLPDTLPPRRSLQSRVRKLDNARYHAGPRTEPILYLIYHATEGDSAESSIGWLNRDLTPEEHNRKASYHYIIDRDGSIVRMCDPQLVAYHAGDSAWPSPAYYPPGNGGHSLNAWSVGIAFANRGDGEPLTPQQLESGLWLSTVWNVPLARVRGHYEIAPGRKFDPAASLNMDDWRQLVARYRAQPPAV
jgi:N-acetyl-anhydromuramyl-L-alanine amidase AmpD